jgi:uncharacterized repeat protein (TIGR03803 family)
MQSKSFLPIRAVARAVMFSIILFGPIAGAWAEQVLYRFQNSPDGAYPQSGVVLHGSALYGTTSGGGTFGSGTVYELRNTDAGWVEKVIYSFPGGSDGGNPVGAVTFDRSDNIYGTAGGGIGYGVIFELKHSRSGWSETVLHTFQGGTDGANPHSDLVFDQLGNIFGAAGAIFELTLDGTTWNYNVIGNVGASNFGRLAITGNENVYGATYGGGNTGCMISCGTVLELTPSGGSWTTNTLYDFLPGDDASAPYANVTLREGNLFGTTYSGGPLQSGAVFELRNKRGVWSESVLYAFTGGSDGGFPASDVAFDRSGNLYSTALGGSNRCGGGGYQCGVIFELTPSPEGWTESVLYNFQPSGGDGWYPESSVIIDDAGNFYGTTFVGGTNGDILGFGTVYEISP